MLSSIEIAQRSHPQQITEIAKQIGLRHEEIQTFGPYKAKVSLDALKRLESHPDGKLILVTAMTPTPQGEGKTCTSIALTQALGGLGKRAMVCIRQPSMGPTFGVKGGGTGGGYSQLIPMEDINLHFTGDNHAVEYAHNLLAGVIGNHIFRGNALDLDPEQILWRRVIDVPDRELRHFSAEVKEKGKTVKRPTGFDITASSEIMASLALSRDLKDLSERLTRIVVGFTRKGKPVTVADLHLQGTLTLILREAARPNLVQTLEGQGAFVHTGPYANIAHGNSSVIATQLALKVAKYVVTESGFGSDLGLEKFFHIVCRQSGLRPDCVILVCSVKALHVHGGSERDVTSLKNGFLNLKRHIENIQKFGIKPILCVNHYEDDQPWELQEVVAFGQSLGVEVSVSEGYLKGSKGALDLAEKVLSAIQTNGGAFKFLYPLDIPIQEKIEWISKELYGAKGVRFSPVAQRSLNHLTALGFGHLPINMAKTHLSFSDDPNVKGAPTDWTLRVQDLRVAAGAGFINCIVGHMLLLPGFPEHPIAQQITIARDGRIEGLF
ncbi:MAG: formate--tetrahydrofolate ligase [Candidatus Omnitrophota bacterium]